MNDNDIEKSTTDDCCKKNRRAWFDWISWFVLGAASLIMSLPVIGFLVGGVIWKKKDQWVPLGKVSKFKPGTTEMVTIKNPVRGPWDGITGELALYVRHLPEGEEKEFQIFWDIVFSDFSELFRRSRKHENVSPAKVRAPF